MSTGDSDRPQLRPVLTSRERQDLINRRETGWMRGLQSMSIDVGHHPFLSAGDSEIVEARFFERLRLGTPYERTLLEHELAAALEAVRAAATTDRAIVVFSLDAAVLGAFVSTSSVVLPKLATLAARANNALALMTLDAGHGLSIDRGYYSDAGEYVAGGVLLLRAWGDFAPLL